MKSTSIRRLTHTEQRLLALAVSGPLAMWLGFIGPSVDQAARIVTECGYYVLLTTFALWLWHLKALRPAAGWRARIDRRELMGAGLLVALFSWLAIRSEPFSAKILNDEFVLQSTAFNLHHFREAGTMVRGYEVNGVFLSLNNYLDKRPLFYPFLVALVHDLSGFRGLNAFLVNAALTPLVLLLVGWHGRKLAGRAAGLLAIALLGTLPLLGQNATGAGMELTNLAMILVSAALAIGYLEQPDEKRLSAFAIALVLLCQSRYESALYVGVGAVVIVLGWSRQRRIILSWPVVIGPLLLVPFALQHKVLSNSPLLWEVTQERSERFSLSYVSGNLEHAWRFFVSRDRDMGNSWYLSILGVFGLGWMVWQLVRFRRTGLNAWQPQVLALSIFGAAVIANLALIMAYYWSALDDPMASRFSLPFCALLAIVGAAAVASLKPANCWPRIALVGALAFTLGVTIPRYARHAYSNLGILELNWMVRAVQVCGPGPCVVLTHKTSVVWLLEKVPAILISRAKLVQDRLRYQLEAGVFRQIFVTQELRPTSKYGQHQVVPEDALPDNFHLEMIVEKRFGTKLVRISRLVALDPVTPASSVTASLDSGQ